MSETLPNAQKEINMPLVQEVEGHLRNSPAHKLICFFFSLNINDHRNVNEIDLCTISWDTILDSLLNKMSYTTLFIIPA